MPPEPEPTVPEPELGTEPELLVLFTSLKSVGSVDAPASPSTMSFSSSVLMPLLGLVLLILLMLFTILSVKPGGRTEVVVEPVDEDVAWRFRYGVCFCREHNAPKVRNRQSKQ